MVDVSSFGVREFIKYDTGIGYQSIIDTTTDSAYIYIGVSVPGMASSSDNWSIARFEIATLTTAWAKLSAEGAGTASFNKVWDDRASYTYN